MIRERKLLLYEAGDSDLPPSLWPGVSTPRSGESRASDARAEAGVHLVYPSLGQVKREPRANTRASLEADLREDTGRKKYIRGRKRRHMDAWLFALREQDARKRMNTWERGFFDSLSQKFEAYGADSVKWITERQYECLKAMSKKYLKLAPEKDAEEAAS